MRPTASPVQASITANTLVFLALMTHLSSLEDLSRAAAVNTHPCPASTRVTATARLRFSCDRTRQGISKLMLRLALRRLLVSTMTLFRNLVLWRSGSYFAPSGLSPPRSEG